MELDYIVKENGKYFAHLWDYNTCDSVGNPKRQHTGDIYGWNGLSYRALCDNLNKDFNINLPRLKDLTMFKSTQCRKCYVWKNQLFERSNA